VAKLTLKVRLVVASWTDAFDQGAVSEVVWFKTGLLHLCEKSPSLFHSVTTNTHVYHRVVCDVVGGLIAKWRLAASVTSSSLYNFKDFEGLVK